MPTEKNVSSPGRSELIDRLATWITYIAIVGVGGVVAVLVFAVFGTVLLAALALAAVVAIGLAAETTLSRSSGELDEAVQHIGQRVTLDVPAGGGLWKVWYRGVLWHALILQGRDMAKRGRVGIISAKQGGTLLVSMTDAA